MQIVALALATVAPCLVLGQCCKMFLLSQSELSWPEARRQRQLAAGGRQTSCGTMMRQFDCFRLLWAARD